MAKEFVMELDKNGDTFELEVSYDSEWGFIVGYNIEQVTKVGSEEDIDPEVFTMKLTVEEELKINQACKDDLKALADHREDVKS